MDTSEGGKINGSLRVSERKSAHGWEKCTTALNTRHFEDTFISTTPVIGNGLISLPLSRFFPSSPLIVCMLARQPGALHVEHIVLAQSLIRGSM
ncbi:hypothetical protein J4Q44_G00019450 [Coregonus suidteri]|uniref:Uncharacterized protein n=1 Tax=Coregonus suidteri TaxID=861788 RepID=A0AAN8R370_9TELE